MPQERRDAVHADPPRADVLMAVQSGPELRLGVVEVDQRQPVDPDLVGELADDAIDAGRLRDVLAGAPEMGEVEAETDALARHAGRVEGSGDRGEFGQIDPESAATAG